MNSILPQILRNTQVLLATKVRKVIFPQLLCDLIPFCHHRVSFNSHNKTTCQSSKYYCVISLIFWVRLLRLSVIQLLGIIPADDVVNTTKSRGDFCLDIHVVFGRDHQDPKSPLEDTDDVFNNIAELHVT